jgi:hippurate hydrolase
MRELASGLAATFGCSAEVDYNRMGKAVVNHAEQAAVAVAAATGLVGDAGVDASMVPVMGSEDFAAMLEARPGAFIFMGQGAGGATSEGLHTPNYDFNDDAIPYGVGYWVSLVGQEMRGAG